MLKGNEFEAESNAFLDALAVSAPSSLRVDQ